MAVELIKTGARIVDGLAVHPNKIKCDYCEVTYELHYSSGEESHLTEGFEKAKRAVNDSHSLHADSLNVPH
jgi:hypothetical protein